MTVIGEGGWGGEYLGPEWRRVFVRVRARVRARASVCVCARARVCARVRDEKCV